MASARTDPVPRTRASIRQTTTVIKYVNTDTSQNGQRTNWMPQSDAMPMGTTAGDNQETNFERSPGVHDPVQETEIVVNEDEIGTEQQSTDFANGLAVPPTAGIPNDNSQQNEQNSETLVGNVSNAVNGAVSEMHEPSGRDLSEGIDAVIGGNDESIASGATSSTVFRLCPPTPSSTTSSDYEYLRGLGKSFSLVNVILNDPDDTTTLLAGALECGVIVSRTVKLPFGKDRYIQYFDLKDKREENKLKRIKDNSSPFFYHFVKHEVPLRLLPHCTKFRELGSYRSILKKSFCQKHVGLCLKDWCLMDSVRNEKGENDLREIVKKRRSDISTAVLSSGKRPKQTEN
ncbi:hypothetical protein GCK72_007024 [Caenorhabditis remanei]|uniref:Uncharacterized protein n=1 Tax=Caenorhabditis remanei TaxID=31234 RepID=A0A6A5HK57_CAERE|nr:hypothetical protein GCK72_007024 [Caenorhabditis remanei]KAF1767066.1 hypothetical protein GCK72_007024 [Caenorhabditis remanei]